MRRFFSFSAAAVLLSAANAFAFDITACHQVVPHGEVGVLQNDLDCGTDTGANVELRQGATLDLNGHSIMGGSSGVFTEPGKHNRATIIGPGAIFGASHSCVSASSRLTMRNVALHDCLNGILTIYEFQIKLTDVTVTANDGSGIVSLAAGDGPGNGRILGRHLTVSGNGGDGIESYGTLKLRDSTIDGNVGAGIRTNRKRYELKNVSVSGNGEAGLLSTVMRPGNIKGSTLTGNGPGGDVAAPSAPKFKGSTCGASVDTDSGGTLGICTGD